MKLLKPQNKLIAILKFRVKCKITTSKFRKYWTSSTFALHVSSVKTLEFSTYNSRRLCVALVKDVFPYQRDFQTEKFTEFSLAAPQKEKKFWSMQKQWIINSFAAISTISHLLNNYWKLSVAFYSLPLSLLFGRNEKRNHNEFDKFKDNLGVPDFKWNDCSVGTNIIY